MASTDGKPSEGVTPSQTAGPFFAFALSPVGYDYPALAGTDLVTEGTVGKPITIAGRVIDGEGRVVTDALVEIWQADDSGRYPGRGTNTPFRGFGRSGTESGGFAFRTIKPGRVPGPGVVLQAPHINVGIFARGIMRRIFTRIYFADEAANADDPVLALVPADRRETLLAKPAANPDGAPGYVLDIRLQGEGETVFFEA